MNIRLEDIAKKLNISKSTVSRALSDHPKISEATKTMVLDAAKFLNYQPNLIAKGLAMKKTKTIGLLISDITNPFYPEIVKGAEEVANNSGYNIILCNTDYKMKKEISYLNILSSKMVDGILLTSTEDISISTALLEKLNTPFVFIDVKPTTSIKANCVYADLKNGSYEATKYLIKNGHKKIAIINGNKSYSSCKQFEDGFIQAMQEFKIKIRHNYFKECDLKIEGGFIATKELLSDNKDLPTAIMYVSDKTAEGGYEVIKSFSMKIPDDISVVGFDDIPEAKYFTPPLSTIRQPKFELGFESMQLLLSNLSEKKVRKFNQIKLLPDLIIRESIKSLI